MSTVQSAAREVSQILQLLQSMKDRRIFWLAVSIVAIVIGGGALAALTPLVLKSLIDGIATAGPSESRLTGLHEGAVYLLLLVLTRVLADIRPFLTSTINQRLHSRLSLRFFEHVLRLPMGYLLKRKGGELLHSLDLASGGTQLVVSHLVGSLLPVLIELITMAIVLIHLHEPALVAVFVAASAVYLLIFSLGAPRMARAASSVATSSTEAYAQLSAGLAHFETLRYFAGEAQAIGHFRAASILLERRWQRLHRLTALIALAASATFAVSTAACLRIGAGAVADGTMTLGGFVLTTVYMMQMVRPLELLGTASRDMSRALGYLHPFLDLLRQPVSIDATPGSPAPSPMKAAQGRAPCVRFDNLHFGYEPGRPVIRGVDLEVPSGCTTAIVGRSGSGKSSLARLLLGLYSPQQGRILLDGRAINSIAAAELRGSLVGLVPQETALLHETIAGNIALGMAGATREAIHAAAVGAQLQELIDALPDGLDTPVGERGLQLSGGERQRVGIARALLRRPGLFILDEPTSMLDSKTELDIQRTLRSVCADATTIVIAHRLSTIVNADEIVVLDDGQIRERGSHQALLEKDGLYARMWRQQTTGCA